MKVDIYTYTQKWDGDKFTCDSEPVYRGFVKVNEFDADEIHHLCNWYHWAEEEPINMCADIDTVGHGLCLFNTETEEWWLAKSSGWLVGDKKEISEYVENNSGQLFWT